MVFELAPSFHRGGRWAVIALVCAGVAAIAHADPGIDTPIRRIYIVAHPHLDIGYTNPPQVVEEECKPKMDAHVAFARQHADYKWNIEETWQLRRWMERSTPEEIAEMMTLIRDDKSR